MITYFSHKFLSLEGFCLSKILNCFMKSSLRNPEVLLISTNGNNFILFAFLYQYGISGWVRVRLKHKYCPILINVINELGQKKSKSSLITLPKMCNVMGCSYKCCHIIWN